MIPLSPNESTLPPAESTSAKDGVEAILQDHEHIRSLFSSYRRLIASNGDRNIKLAVLKDIVRAQSRHASAEERTLYPLARDKILIGPDHSTSKLLYNGLLIDDQAIKLQWQHLYDYTPATDEEWSLYDRQVDLAATLEEMHFGKEEEEVLLRFREMLTNKEKEDLWVEWSKASRLAPLQPHPEGPSGAALAGIVQPLAGVADRAKEAVSSTLKHFNITEAPGGPETAPTEATPAAKAGKQHQKSTVEKDATSPAELLQG